MGSRYLLLSAALGASLSATAVHAEDYRIRMHGYVPIECEMSVSPDFVALAPGSYRIARVSQFCNSGYQLTMSHAALDNPLLASFRGETVTVTGTDNVLIADGRPVDSAADLVVSGQLSDAMLLGSTVTLLVTPSSL